jgi:hypothetical protein
VLLLLLGLALVGCASSPPATSPGAAPDGALAEVAWLAGTWVSPGGKGPRTEEHWIPPAGGSMLGVNRTVIGGRTAFFEFLRLEADEQGLVYHAAPMGRHPATPFRLVEVTPGRVVFENPRHDFPQRIIYRRDGDRGLVQRIEGTEAGETKSSEWRLRRE